MAFLILWLLFGIVYTVYIYKVSYFYDYKYIGNPLRFVTVYVGSNMVFSLVLDCLGIDILLTGTIFSLLLGLIICVLYRRFLINKFGKAERFANTDEIEDIGIDKKED